MIQAASTGGSSSETTYFASAPEGRETKDPEAGLNTQNFNTTPDPSRKPCGEGNPLVGFLCHS